jgi:hypothetical protein
VLDRKQLDQVETLAAKLAELELDRQTMIDKVLKGG